MSEIIRFQDALPKAVNFVQTNDDNLGQETIIIRDLYGKIRLFLQIEPNEQLNTLAQSLSVQLGNFGYPAPDIFIYKTDFFDPDSVINSPDKLKITSAEIPIYLLDRQIIGQDWTRIRIYPDPLKPEPNHVPRVALFGIKGGVGRSTALALFAWDLARQGKKVLVVDLDLESPGIGQILLPQAQMADYGVVDWLVEDAVGQSESLLMDMVSTSPLARDLVGDMRVVSAAGCKETDYVAKLDRIYRDIKQNGQSVDFAHRLDNMLRQLAERERPDFILLDSRAGLHDIAAVAITRLTDLALLFAVNTPQTWQAYRYLFTHWNLWSPDLASFRGNLKIVAGMIPETGREDYLADFTESAYNLFADTLYEEDQAGEGFNFDVKAIDAPHFPLKIFWHRGFQDFNPLKQFNTQDVALCYGDFLREVNNLVSGVMQDG